MQRHDERFSDRTMTLAELDRFVWDYGKGCEEGQKEFVLFVQGGLLDEDEQEELRKEQELKSLTANADYCKRTGEKLGNHPFVAREDYPSFCQHCNRYESSHDYRPEEQRPDGYSPICSCDSCRAYRRARSENAQSRG